MSDYQNHIGAQIEKKTFVLDDFRLENYHTALGILNIKKDAPIPNVLLSSLGAYRRCLDLLGVDVTSVLHSRELFEPTSPLFLGDKIEVTTHIQDLFEQQGNISPLGIVEVVVTLKKAKKSVLTCTRTYAVRGGFARGQR